MQTEAQEKIVTFLEQVNIHLKNGMPLRDAIDLAAVTVGDFIPSVAMKAANKYQEATNPKMPLSQEEDADALAFATMGHLWHGESYEETEEQTLEELLAQSLYLILKYGKDEGGIKAVLSANAHAPGDREAREAAIKMALG
jgi:type II secretory pathway component PulF